MVPIWARCRIRPMNPAILVSLQMALYAALWWLASHVLPQERRPMLHWAAYALATAAATALVGWRALGPPWLCYTGASALLVLSLVLARRGAELFLGLRPADRETLLLLGLVLPLLMWIGPAPDRAAARVALGALASCWLVLAALPRAVPAVRREFGARAVWGMAPPLLALCAINLFVAARAVLGDAAQASIHQAGAIAQIVTWGTTLVAAAAFNILFLAMVVMRLLQRLHHEATHDPLTGLLNRRAMNAALQAEWDRHARFATPFAVLSLDIDHFKRINDSRGHETGDQVLQEVARRLHGAVREIDRIGRTGGEEFLVLMPGCSADSDGLLTAERLRRAVGGLPVQLAGTPPLRVTLSAGVAGPAAADAGVSAMLQRCDRALYCAKSQGRDRVALQAAAVTPMPA